MDIYSIRTRKELAIVYGISREALRGRLTRMGITHSTLLTPKEIQRIFNEWGTPLIEINPKKKT